MPYEPPLYGIYWGQIFVTNMGGGPHPGGGGQNFFQFLMKRHFFNFGVFLKLSGDADFARSLSLWTLV